MFSFANFSAASDQMRTQYREFEVEITDDPVFTPHSADNLNRYDTVLFDETYSGPMSKHGIRILKDGLEHASAIICETGGATAIHDKSFVIQDDNLFLCCCNKVYSLQLPDLKYNWKHKFDTVTCFAIHPFNGDFIIHGELEIKRINPNGIVKWDFSAADIFVTHDGTEAFTIEENKITLTDWDGNKYVLDENGRLTK